MSTSDRWIPDRAGPSANGATWGRFSRPALPVVVVSLLLCLGAANIASRAAFREVEDGVLWAARAEGVVAADIARRHAGGGRGHRARRPAARHRRPPGRGVRPTSSTRPARRRPRRDAALHRAAARLARRHRRARSRPFPAARASSTSCSPAVGTFTLLVGGAVRLRRPRDPATLHFLWLVGRVLRRLHLLVQRPARSARLGVLLGRRRSRSWRCRRCSCTSRWSFPSGPRALDGTRLRAALLEVRELRAGGRPRPRARGRRWRAPPTDAAQFVRVSDGARRLEFLYLAVCFIGGLAGCSRARSRRVRTVTARRQLRWIAWGTAFGAGPFALGYALPYALGVEPSLPMQLSAIPLSLIPLAYASAIVRYRLMDIEVIVKRALVYAAALSARRRDLRRAAQGRRSACSSRAAPANQWVHRVPGHAGRRAAGAAGEELRPERARSRVLPRPLRLPPRARRLCPRPEQRPRSAPPGRAAGLARRRDAASRLHGADARETSRRRTSARCAPPGSATRIRRRWPSARASAARLAGGHLVALDDPTAVGRFAGRGDRVLARRRPLLLRAVRRARKARSRCWRSAARTRASRSAARTWRCWPRWPARLPPRSRTPGSTGSCR